jgi:hypothetical protein
VSSILEALRELETRRPPATQTVAAPAEQPTTVNRAVETLGILSIGLVLGVLGFLLFIGISGLLQATASREDRPLPSGAEEPAPRAGSRPRERRTDAQPSARPSDASHARPAWLETADPPRARVERQAPARTEEPARASAERPVRESRVEASGTAPVEIAAIDYSPDAARRTVTLRLDGGTVVRLRERESAKGIEVQLIQQDGVYLRRGAEVFMLSPAR